MRGIHRTNQTWDGWRKGTKIDPKGMRKLVMYGYLPKKAFYREHYKVDNV